MRKSLRRMLCLAFLSALALFGQKTSIEGDWEGSIQANGGKLRLRLHITRESSGALSAKFDSPDQGAFGLPVSTVSFADGVLHFEMTNLRASFTGKLNAAANEVDGTFRQGMEFPMTLKRMTAAEAPLRPQEPRPPYPYQTIEVTFPSKAPGVTLAGTLTMPQGKGPFPAVVLITGSGPQDRDEAIFEHRPFLVLADFLTRNEIAVLRYDDRGVGKSNGNFATSTTTDFSRDAEGAFDYLKGRGDIVSNSIGLLGHSEGGSIAPMVAARRPDAAFVVMLAGTGVPGKDLLLMQAAKINAAAGAPPAMIKKNTEIQEGIFAVLAEDKDNESAQAKIKALLAGVPSAEAQAKSVTGPWMREFVFYDPAPTLAKLKCPVLALNGTLDLQVDADQNLPPIEAALKKGGNTNYRIVRLPRLNHLFQPAETGRVSEYGQIPVTMSPLALETIGKWVREQTHLDPPQGATK
jgi:uncharacterized protein